MGWHPKKVYIGEKSLLLRVRSAKENDSRQHKPKSMLLICLNVNDMITKIYLNNLILKP